jgi:hypothetical protein
MDVQNELQEIVPSHHKPPPKGPFKKTTSPASCCVGRLGERVEAISELLAGPDTPDTPRSRSFELRVGKNPNQQVEVIPKQTVAVNIRNRQNVSFDQPHEMVIAGRISEKLFAVIATIVHVVDQSALKRSRCTHIDSIRFVAPLDYYQWSYITCFTRFSEPVASIDPTGLLKHCNKYI